MEVFASTAASMAVTMVQNFWANNPVIAEARRQQQDEQERAQRREKAEQELVIKAFSIDHVIKEILNQLYPPQEKWAKLLANPSTKDVEEDRQKIWMERFKMAKAFTHSCKAAWVVSKRVRPDLFNMNLLFRGKVMSTFTGRGIWHSLPLMDKFWIWQPPKDSFVINLAPSMKRNDQSLRFMCICPMDKYEQAEKSVIKWLRTRDKYKHAPESELKRKVKTMLLYLVPEPDPRTQPLAAAQLHRIKKGRTPKVGVRR